MPYHEQRYFLIVVSGLVALMSVPNVAAIVQTAAPMPTQATANYAPPGKRVDIGGRFLHLYCTGKGGPTVVLEAGAGGCCLDWSFVQPGVARFARVCSYDRAGFGWSDPGPVPRTGQQIAYELHTALHKAGITGPYVLVGQSFGGFLVRSFARFYPKEVAGMVLVDCLHEDSRIVIDKKVVRIRETAQGRTAPPIQMAAQTAAPAGSVEGVRVPPIPSDRTKMASWREPLQNWVERQPDYSKTWRQEMDWSPEDVADLYAHQGSPQYRFDNKPLIVVSRGSLGYEEDLDVRGAELEAERTALQEKLARLSTNSQHIVATRSGHNIQDDDPDLVIDAIRRVVEATRTRSPLASSASSSPL